MHCNTVAHFVWFDATWQSDGSGFNFISSLTKQHSHLSRFRNMSDTKIFEPYNRTVRRLKAAMSTSPPTGLVTTPTRPLPIPLMRPAAPFRLAPAGHSQHARYQDCKDTQQTTEPRTGCRTIPVTPSNKPCRPRYTLHEVNITILRLSITVPMPELDHQV